jgi:hypothetical protein
MAWLIASPQQHVPLATRCLLILPSSTIRSQSLYNPNPKLGLRPTPQIRCRDETLPDPLEEIENIIRETGIKDNVDQERAFRIVGEHFAHNEEEQLFCT